VDSDVEDGVPLLIERQGSFTFGGRTDSRDDDVFLGDHGYARYQIPITARPYPLVFWHGASTSGAGWESTPDDRESFQSLLLRRGFATYVIDQPRKGRSGGSPFAESMVLKPASTVDSWNMWRLGVWDPPGPREFHTNLQMDTRENVVDQLLRQRTPEIGPSVNDDFEVALDAMDALLQRTGPCVLVLHSNSGKDGWRLRIRNDLVAGIVAYEPSAFVFSESDQPEDIPTTSERVRSITHPILVAPEDFMQLARIPIQLVYGDNIHDVPSENLGVELWRVNLQRAKQFQAAINRVGGSVELLELPTIGITGNTHFAFSDTNNVEIAELFVSFLEAGDLG
jgi:pimeloyl-ACP methyl ester carboxylesterase